MEITLTVDGVEHRSDVEPRLLLSDFLRHSLALTGTHVGCEHGVWGACTVLMDGVAVRAYASCSRCRPTGARLATVEGLAPGEGELHPIQEAFREEHGLQCGFCTPGILMTLVPFLRENPDPSEAEVRDALSGNLCRCTESCGLDAEGLPGGLQIVGRPSGEESVLALARLVQERHPLGEPPLGAGAS